MSSARLRKRLFLLLVVPLAAMIGCSGSTKSSSSNESGNTPSSGSSGSNVQPISVNVGPTAGPPYDAPYVDAAFTSLTLCAPGSTTNCQTINNVLVDTGSFGLRILSSALTVSLPQQTGSNGNPIVECAPFLDGITWGPVQTADFTIAGEQAKSLPIQIVGSSSFSAIPAACTNYGAPMDDLADLGANGILGVGNYVEDCGTACSVTGASNPGLYYACPSSGCEVTTEPVADQVQNPVASFATDNNGVLVELPAVSGAETSISGSLIFGIGTQSNNALGSATVYGIDLASGNFTTVFDGVSYTNGAYIDSGSNALYFLDSAVTGMPTCVVNTFWYCPSSTAGFSATDQGSNGATGTINFSVGNANALTANGSNAAVSGLAGPNPGMIDWGLPFFFGRNVFVAIAGQSTPGGTGPYWAF